MYQMRFMCQMLSSHFSYTLASANTKQNTECLPYAQYTRSDTPEKPSMKKGYAKRDVAQKRMPRLPNVLRLQSYVLSEGSCSLRRPPPPPLPRLQCI